MGSEWMEKSGLRRPLIVAPMAGGPSSVALVAEASKAGALGSVGAAYMSPQAILEFAGHVRRMTDCPFALNLFIPHAVPDVSAASVEEVVKATAAYREELAIPVPRLSPPYEEDFAAQFEAVLEARPAVFSYVFGLLPEEYAYAARKAGVLLIGTATTLQEALALEASGADAIVLQGIEAGGHRGIFEPSEGDREIGLFDLLETCVARVKLPLIAAGGIMTAAHIRKALKVGAQCVQMGTAFLACREAGTSAAYKAKLLESPVRNTRTTRVFSGRLARGIENRFMREMEGRSGAVLPFPAQNAFTRDLRSASAARGSADFLSLWSGTGYGELWQGTVPELMEQLFPSGD